MGADLKLVYGDGYERSEVKKGDYEILLVPKGSHKTPKFMPNTGNDAASAKELIEFAHEHATEPKWDKAAAIDAVEAVLKKQAEEKAALEAMIAEEEAELEAWNQEEKKKKDEQKEEKKE